MKPLFWVKAKKLMIFSGLANPLNFEKTVISLAPAYIERLDFKDHHNFKPKDIALIRKKAEKMDADYILTTEKDLVKLPDNLNINNLYVLKIEFTMLEDNTLKDMEGQSMKKDSKVEFLREKNLEKAIELIKEKGKFAILSEYSTFFDMRTYFKVNEDGDITQKSYNPITLLYLFCDDEKKLAEYLFKYSYPEEKQNIKKIDRASNLDIETLKKNLMKTLTNSNLDFSKIFAKELFLRDRKAFFETMYNFALMGNPKDLKLFFVYTLEEIFSKIAYDENIFYTIIAYLTKSRDDYSTYMETSNISFDIETYSDDKKIYINIFEKVLERYSLKNENKFKISLYKYFVKDFVLNQDLKNILMEKMI